MSDAEPLVAAVQEYDVPVFYAATLNLVVTHSVCEAHLGAHVPPR